MSLVICLGAWVLCDIIGAAIKNNFAADVIFILMMMVIVYLIYVHYCAVFSYEITDKKLLAIRRIGRREIKEEIKLGKINKIYFSKPDNLPKQVLYMTVNIIRKKNLCYIVYDKGSKCLVIQPDNELTRILKESING